VDRYLTGTLLCVCLLLPATVRAAVLSPADVLRLTRAGAGSELVAEIVRSNAIYRALVTVDGVVEMKEAGVEDSVILALIEAGDPTVDESVAEDSRDRRLQRELARREQILDLQRRELAVLRTHLVRLITNERVLELVDKGAVSGGDYAEIVRYLKAYAAGEESTEVERTEIRVTGDAGLPVREERRLKEFLWLHRDRHAGPSDRARPRE
jgi:hypothetical protein